MSKVSIIIINYNTFRLTTECIRSVIAHTHATDYEIILVDNASTECDPDLFTREFPQITLVKSNRNGGFAYGNNLGIEKATGDFILLLNSDTLLTEDSVGKTVSFLQAQEGAGIAGCRMVYPDGKIQYTARHFRTIRWELLDLFRFVPFLMPYRIRSKKMLGKYFRHDTAIQAGWLNGAFFLFKKAILNTMPDRKLDERFFMYGEDQLWCWQSSLSGYSSWFYAGTTIVHINSGSTDIRKQLTLRRTMFRHELEIMRLRKGRGLYYYMFQLIYGLKEGTRNLLKRIVFRLTSRIIR